MKSFPFTINFVTNFTDEEYARLSKNFPDPVLEMVAKKGLVELLEPHMQAMNEGATKVTVHMAEQKG